MARVHPPSRRPAPGDDGALAEALACRDEAVFAELVERWSSGMLALALARVDSRAVAEEVVQEAWLTALRRAGTFEGRSSLRTWVLGIVVNVARARARAERRATHVEPDAREPLVDPRRFRPRHADEWPGHWAVGPVPWPTPEQELLAGETRRVILDAVAALPPMQREVLVLRDVAGCSGAETCNILGLSDTNGRVLLHRARSRVRHALENYFGATEPT